jgi:DNA-binding transcriptional ArsR family regulator
MTEPVKYPTDDQTRQMAEVFDHLGDETRQRVIRLLIKNPGGLSGKEISQELQKQGGVSSQPVVSFVVEKLAEAGLVENHRDGRNRISQLAPNRSKLLTTLISTLAKDLDANPVEWPENEAALPKAQGEKTGWQEKRARKEPYTPKKKAGKTQAAEKPTGPREHTPAPVMTAHQLFPKVTADHTLLYISPNEPTAEEKNQMGGELAFGVTHATTLPKQHDASVVIIDGRNGGKVRVCNLIEAAKKVKDCPVFVIDGQSSPNYYLANGAIRVFTPDELPLIGNHAIAAIATHTGAGLSLC